jgi:signal transduction histidine kinase
MLRRITFSLAHSSLLQRFTLVSFLIVIAGTAGIGWWVGEQIKLDAIQESATTTALYMDSFIAPNLQELSQANALTPEHIAILSDLLQQTTLGRQVVTFKVWDDAGRIVFSTTPSLIGRIFPIDEDLKRSWQGQVVAGISDLQNAENVEDRRFSTRLLQIYSPVRQSGTGRIIAVAELYQSVDALEAEIGAAQIRSWLVVGATMTGIYLLLVGFVRWASATIGRQESKLHQQVVLLTDLLAQNADLHERVRGAAARIATLDERFLRRISAELHDGPAQELGLALLRFDSIVGQADVLDRDVLQRRPSQTDVVEIYSSVQRAFQELRSIAAGLGLPILKSLTMAEVLTRVVSTHERRTGTYVKVSVEDHLPSQAPLPIKITAYRVIQEALNNACRHAGGIGLQVHVRYEAGSLYIEVSDQGPGFDASRALDGEEHLGVAGMRERVESQGGDFRIESAIGRGTRVIACLPLQPEGGLGER